MRLLWRFPSLAASSHSMRYPSAPSHHLLHKSEEYPSPTLPILALKLRYGGGRQKSCTRQGLGLLLALVQDSYLLDRLSSYLLRPSKNFGLDFVGVEVCDAIHQKKGGGAKTLVSWDQTWARFGSLDAKQTSKPSLVPSF